jgi:predicted P-loop ATPase
MIASCARIFEPGVQVDTVLTLVGSGGKRKSSLIERLYRVEGAETFRTDLPDHRDMQKIGQALDGVWAVELAELAFVRKADVEGMKSFLTRRVERYSPKYIAGEVSRPRQCIFIGSVNQTEFLSAYDEAFRRRFWPVMVQEKLDMAAIDKVRDALWAEAYAAYRAGEPWWFEDESETEEGRTEFIESDPWSEPIRNILAIAPTQEDRKRWVTSEHVWFELHQDLRGRSGYDKVAQNQVSQALQALGCVRGRFSQDGKQVRGWQVPDTIKHPTTRVAPAPPPFKGLAQTLGDPLVCLLHATRSAFHTA